MEYTALTLQCDTGEIVIKVQDFNASTSQIFRTEEELAKFINSRNLTLQRDEDNCDSRDQASFSTIIRSRI